MARRGHIASLEANAIPQLSIVYKRIEDLKPNLKNPRLHSEKQIKQIARSIEAFGFNVPILTDSQMRVIAGLARVKASKQLNIREVPTISLEHLTEAQIQAFTIADNRLTENATWDNHLLAEQFKMLSEVELNFSLEDTGFEMGEIDLLIEGLAPGSAEESDPADTLPAIESQAPVTQLGDLWLLKHHRVLCADSLKEETYRQLMQEQKAAAVFTDPPYNVPIDGFVTGSGKTHHAEFAMASGEMTIPEFTAFLSKAFSHLPKHTKQGALHFICIDWRHLPEMLAAGAPVYGELKNLCVWVKNSGGLGSLYRSQHELVFVYKSGKEKHRNNIQLGQFGRNRTNVWQYPRVASFGRDTEEGRLATIHPTVKPVALVADAIMDCTSRGEIVLDPFLGSGTTLIAAQRTGRICYGIELEPAYVDAIVRRWQSFTGLKAVHADSNLTFAAIEAGGAQ
jgi:DNA modification methylase